MKKISFTACFPCLSRTISDAGICPRRDHNEPLFCQLVLQTIWCRQLKKEALFRELPWPDPFLTASTRRFRLPSNRRAYGCFYKVCLQYRPVLFWNSTRHRRSGASRIRSRCRRHLSLFFFTNKLSKSHAADGYNINREHLNKKVKNVPYGVSAFSLSNKIVVVFDIICIRSFFSNARFLWFAS